MDDASERCRCGGRLDGAPKCTVWGSLVVKDVTTFCKTGICFEALEDEYVCEEDWEALVWLFEGGGDDLGEVFPSVTLFTSTRGSGTVLNILS